MSVTWPESQNFICKIIVIKSTLVEPIRVSVPSVGGMPLLYIGFEVLAGGFGCNTPRPRLAGHLTKACPVTVACPPGLTGGLGRVEL